MRQEKLDQIIEMLPITKNMVNEDISIGVWDREGTLLHLQEAESFKINLEVGYIHQDKSDKLFEAMSTGKTVHNILPKEVFGVAMEGNLVPIFDEGKVVGCVTCSFSAEQREQLQQHAEVIKEVSTSVEKLEKSVNGIFDVVDSIKGNTSSIKMLALNAAIEAARAGEYGRGFTIVANEMGKLSQMSSESVAGINETLNDISKSIEEVKESIERVE